MMTRLDLTRSALIAVDLQRYFLAKGAPAFLHPPKRLIPNALRVIEAFRGAGLPVLFTRHAHRRGADAGEMGRFWGRRLPWEGTRPAELIAEVAPLPGEPVLRKERYSAFEGTALAECLRLIGVEQVVLLGVMTNVCVETTARHAFMKDFQVTVARDACWSSRPQLHRAALANLEYAFARLATTTEIVKQLNL